MSSGVGAFRVGETNNNGLTWQEWFYATGKASYSVDANWSPVLTKHEELFWQWKVGVDPSEIKAHLLTEE